MSDTQLVGYTDDEGLSGVSDAALLQAALKNEKASPEILQYDADLVSRIESQIDYQARSRGYALGEHGKGCVYLLPHASHCLNVYC
jgi:hypothetical protein